MNPIKTLIILIAISVIFACDPLDSDSDPPPKTDQPKRPINNTCKGVALDFFSALNNNPLYAEQWYLKNTGQNGATRGLDINVESAWQQGCSGKDVTVAVFDDMVDIRHEDYRNNLVKFKVISGSGYHTDEDHGTAVAGIIAAEHNDKGIVGVAPHASIYAFGITTPKGHQRDHWDSFSQGSEDIAVYNFSFGLNNVGSYNEKDLPIHAILDKGIQNGWGGLGSSYVTSSGNFSFSHGSGEIMGAHHGVIGVSGVDKTGDIVPFGVKFGLQHWVSAFTKDIVTTDHMAPDGADSKSNYRKDFGGTSSAAPMVAGVAALIRQANPNLTYRDVKLILAETASKDGGKFSTWTWSHTGGKKSLAGNYQYNDYLGFGIVDAGEAVKLAKKWQPLTQPITVEDYRSSKMSIQPNENNLQVAIPVSSSNIQFTEFIQFTMDFLLVEAKLSKLQLNFATITVTDAQGREHELINTTNAASFVIPNPKFKYVVGYNLYLGNNSPAANSGQWQVTLKREDETLKDGSRTDHGKLGEYFREVQIAMKVYGH